MALRTQRRSSSWLQRVAAILGAKSPLAHPRPIRRLSAEALERRIVLSVAPAPECEDGACDPSLAEYASQEPVMGPLPADTYESGDSATTTYSDPGTSDQYFASYYGEGEGGGSGSGSGTAGGSASGGGGDAYSSGSGSGGGTGSGSGAGSSSGSTNLPPTVSASIGEPSSWLRIYGSVSDDGTVAGLSVSISGLVNASATTNADGQFEVSILWPAGTGWIYITATDSQGLTSEPFAIFIS